MVAQNQLARTIFDGLSVSYDSVVDLMTLHQDASWKKKMLMRLHLRAGDRVLDVGCGTGVLEEDLGLRGCEVVGVDITSAMIKRAKQKEHRFPSVPSLGLADAEHLPFRDESFDHVISCYVPKYCDTNAFVRELGRVLRRGGKMAVYDFTRPTGPFSPLLSLYESGLLPVLGRLMGPIDESLAFTCRALPGLIRTTAWDRELDGVLAPNGLERMGKETPTSGVVTIFWASRR